MYHIVTFIFVTKYYLGNKINKVEQKCYVRPRLFRCAIVKSLLELYIPKITWYYLVTSLRMRLRDFEMAINFGLLICSRL